MVQPGSWGLFKSIERPLKFVDMSWFRGIRKPEGLGQWVMHVNGFREMTIEKDIFNIKFPAIGDSNGTTPWRQW